MHWNEPGVCNPLGWVPEAVETRPQATPTTQEHAKELVLFALSSFDVVVCEVSQHVTMIIKRFYRHSSPNAKYRTARMYITHSNKSSKATANQSNWLYYLLKPSIVLPTLCWTKLYVLPETLDCIKRLLSYCGHLHGRPRVNFTAGLDTC
ncbi:hypothetical protein KQX54_021081 [Cotesia glomerata]|uniref:Uncharacterized protein n=1 Tax=Cotesia glomerata TaxID=32391 RepID=A0AAV7J8B2_COTGL|nr:hypothetical protein KQX54_021081 [Cotesia glomerata]